MTQAYLPTRALLHMTGADVHSFLQGLVTNDVRAVERGEAVYACLLSPQGKFLYDLMLYPYENGVLVEAEAARLPKLVQMLKLYKLKADVVIAARPELHVSAVWDEAPPAGAFPDPRGLGFRVISTTPAPANEAAYTAHRIAYLVPEGDQDFEVEKSLVLEFGLERLRGVDFAKGCYVGQEVTARMKYRANIRRTLVSVEGNAALEHGGEVMSAGAAVGTLKSTSGTRALAHLQKEALGGQLMAGQVEIRVLNHL